MNEKLTKEDFEKMDPFQALMTASNSKLKFIPKEGIKTIISFLEENHLNNAPIQIEMLADGEGEVTLITISAEIKVIKKGYSKS